MKRASRAFLLILLALSLPACDYVRGALGMGTPTPMIMADWFFYSCAYVDANGNGEIDADDEPLEGAVFSVALQGGMGTGGRTYSDGCAMAHVPGGLDDDAWPVTLRMTPPKETSYRLVGPEQVVQEYPGSSVDFLFALP